MLIFEFWRKSFDLGDEPRISNITKHNKPVIRTFAIYISEKCRGLYLEQLVFSFALGLAKDQKKLEIEKRDASEAHL